MFMYPIDKDVPPPDDRNRLMNYRKRYPFSRMEVGESVFIPDARTDGKEYSAARKIARTRGWRFTARNTVGGMRIWRVK